MTQLSGPIICFSVATVDPLAGTQVIVATYTTQAQAIAAAAALLSGVVLRAGGFQESP